MQMKKALAAIVLAAGKGARMNSSLPKVLHPLSGKSLLAHVLDTVFTLSPDRVIVVVGYQAEDVRSAFPDPRIEFVEQKEQLGTGHAVLQAKPLLENFAGNVLIVCGDMPFVKASTLKTLTSHHRETNACCTLLTLKTGETKDFGRILRNERGGVADIVENRDATDSQKTIDEYNSGVYLFSRSELFEALGNVDNHNSQAEYYLTDTIRYLAGKRLTVEAVQTRDANEIFGINSEQDLRKAEQLVLESR